MSAAQIDITNTAAASDWDWFVNAHPEATGYHLSAWRDVFQTAFGHQTEYLSASRSGRITGVLPLVQFDSWLFGKFFVSLPFVNYGGVLADDQATAEALVESATVLARERGLAHVEFRHTARRFPSLAAKQHKVTMLLPLPGEVQQAWDQMDRRVRNHVRKGEKSGLQATSGGAELLGAFYPVFAENMRDLGTPVYGRRFFEQILAHVGTDARVFVVTLERKPVAASITIGYRGKLEVPWSSSLKQYRMLNANTLLYWEMLKWAIEHRFHTFDFGRSTPNDGPYQFKAQWKAQPHPLSWEYALVNGSTMPDQSPKNPKFSLAIRLWQRLPVSVATTLGPSIVRSIP
ncbi:MAG: FemAB family PEP-CTERM system-associated protein [Acidobacteria bacterium]|nr:FemAB family PEP-CTERM system-associated protein [Acidobacteriota bacterium]